jgi:hypothetical protein
MQKPAHPPIRFFHAAPKRLLAFDEEKLGAAIPLATSEVTTERCSSMTYDSYLKAIQRFIFGHWDQFLEALFDQGLAADTHVAAIDIISEKHGSDYHPAQVRVHADRAVSSFVVNVAVTDRGKSRLAQDFRLLQYLRVRHGKNFVPKVYFLGDVSPPEEVTECAEPAMFLGEWLDDYHEFHLSQEEENVSPATVLWDMNRGHTFLSESEAAEVYRQAAFILTYYYDTQTLSEVYPWHHASGDFVVCRSCGTIRVKLITVRQYASRMVFEHEAPENVIEALLVFFANLTLRMRLDRYDGVGPVAWAGGHCVEATLGGFLDALRTKIVEGSCDRVLVQEFIRMAGGLSPTELVQVFQPAIEAYDQEAPDVPVVLDNLAEHIFLVYQVLQKLPLDLEFS